MSNIQNTSAATVLSSEHGRMRRAERLIDKRDLQAALKYGTREKSYNQRGNCQWKYRFADIVYITDETGRREITSWAKPGAGLDIEKVKISEKMKLGHKRACKRISHDVCNWTSHTVIVVDQSGSMRKTDVEGGATRSDAVWLTIAMDFVAKQLDSGESTATDVVSIISMGNEGTILVDKKPHDWILFNTVVDLLRTQEPHFDGNYLPALDRAENLLLSNTFGSCALTLFFLSDGRPSDTMPRGGGGHYQIIGERIDALSSRFGRRLSLMVVGFAQSEDFSVLKEMANRPKKFQSSGKFFAARLNPDALGEAFSSIATSLTTTRSELTAIGGSHQRAVRDVRRKAIDTVGQSTMPDDNNWYTYEGDYSRYVYSHEKPKGFVQSPTLTTSVQVRGVALARSFFGEGAERLVREFREIGPNGRFVGPKLVAKESRFQMDIENTDQRQILNFQKTFCDTQGRAQGLANVFNERLEKLPGYDPLSTPKISFLDCSVYFVNDINLGALGCLVEKQLDPLKYKKWNDNCGAVNGDRGVIEQSSPPNDMLDIIAEESDEEEDSEYESEEENDSEVIHPLDIPQAFSHFTYRYTKRKLLVCDLQGVLSETIPPLFELTDPVIHFLSRHGKKNTFGRTDRGRSGRNDFFRTHKCSPLCRMLMRRHVRRVGSEQRSSHFEGLEENVSNLHFN
jgi:Mg-chelatase subunit ChlD